MRPQIAFHELPVYRHKDLILKSLEENQVIVVESPTGSGKTTQLPLILREAGYDKTGIIGITQPRRIATLSICEFIKAQLEIGDNYCAYTMRFDDTSDETTRIKVMTDGILLQELKGDRTLSRYSVIMVDEAHERSLNIDFILGLLKQVVEVRKDLKVIISSATINTKKFSDFFGGARIISIEAKTYPVEVRYTPPEVPDRRQWPPVDELTLRLSKIYEIVEAWLKEDKGDVLIFLSGEFEILQCDDMLRHAPFRSELEVYPLYGRLSKEEQERVFTPTGESKTKVVIATNIAETSITIDGIRCVIDSGMAKVNFYDQKTFTSALKPQPISKASAEQRKGRAGRTQPGVCHRLYTEESFNSREDYSKEEITRSDLAEVALRMSDLGILDYDNFPFITAPNKASLASAEYTLKYIEAIDDERRLTKIGEMMVLFPLLPRLSRAIVEAVMNRPDVLEEVLIAVSFLSTKGPFLFPQDKAMLARQRQERFQDSVNGDFAGYLKLYRAYSETIDKDDKSKSDKFCKRHFLDIQTMNEIVHIKEQLEEIVGGMGVPITGGGSMASYLTCLAVGLIQFVCARRERGDCYHSVTADAIYIHPSCSWFGYKPSYILAGEVVQTSRMFARSVSPLKQEWLEDIHPGLKEQLKRGGGSAQKPKEGKEQAKASAQGRRLDDETYLLFDEKYKFAKASGGKKKKAEAPVSIPLSGLDALIKKAFKAGKVPRINVVLHTADGDSLHMGLKLLVQEGALVVGKKTLKRVPDTEYTLEDGHSALASALDDLFRPTPLGESSKRIGFVALRHTSRKGGSIYRFYPCQTLTAAVDSTYHALTDIQNRGRKRKDRYEILLGKASSLIDKLNELEGLDA